MTEENKELEIPEEMRTQVAITNMQELLSQSFVDKAYNWGRRNSVWPVMFGLACCAIEMICTAAARYDIALRVCFISIEFTTKKQLSQGSSAQAAAYVRQGHPVHCVVKHLRRVKKNRPPKFSGALFVCVRAGIEVLEPGPGTTTGAGCFTAPGAIFLIFQLLWPWSVHRFY